MVSSSGIQIPQIQLHIAARIAYSHIQMKLNQIAHI
jgi:hypothetical protein